MLTKKGPAGKVQQSRSVAGNQVAAVVRRIEKIGEEVTLEQLDRIQFALDNRIARALITDSSVPQVSA